MRREKRGRRGCYQGIFYGRRITKKKKKKIPHNFITSISFLLFFCSPSFFFIPKICATTDPFSYFLCQYSSAPIFYKWNERTCPFMCLPSLTQSAFRLKPMLFQKGEICSLFVANTPLYKFTISFKNPFLLMDMMH